MKVKGHQNSITAGTSYSRWVGDLSVAGYSSTKVSHIEQDI